MEIRITNLQIFVLLVVGFDQFSSGSAKLIKVYEENPFLNGEFQPGINLPQGPVNDPVEDGGNWPPINAPIQVNHQPVVTPPPTVTIKPGQPIGPIRPPVFPTERPPVVQPPHPTHPPSPPNDLLKYCLQPRGTFQGRYCNAFVSCWDGNAVEQFCGTSLVFNPKGYCDYVWNVNCNGKPIKELPSSPGGSNGWPSDGSYVPPPSPSPPEPKPPLFPTRPPVTVRPPYVPGGPIFTIEPPGFGSSQADPTLPPIYRPPHDHTHTMPTPTPPHHTPSTTTTWRPTIVTHPTPGNPDLKKYCLHPRGQFAGPHCNKFVNCWDEVVIEQECPFGLNFNPNKHYCDFPYNYPCRIFKDAEFEYNPEQQSFAMHQDNHLGF